MSLDIDDGTKFPDPIKAAFGKTVEDLVKGLVNDDKEFFGYAQETKTRLRNQKDIDLKSFIQSQSGAIARGNQNACDSRDKFDKVAKDLAKKTQPIVIPTTRSQLAQGMGKLKTDLPKTRSVTPTRGARSRPPSMSHAKINQSLSSAVGQTAYGVQAIATDNYAAKSKRNIDKFARAHSGLRGTSVGDRAVVFSANGTPHYGDSYLDKNLAENMAANQATANAPLTQIPSKIKTTAPINAAPLQQQPRANVAPKSDSVGNMLVLGGIAAAVTAVLFFFQYVLIFVQFILQISSVTSTITNIASSFVAILNNIGALFGLGEGVVEPLEKTFDGILNNVFGKDKVDYVKFQFAKISAAYVAGQNLLSKFNGVKDTMGKVVEKNADNTSKIGNALKMAGMIADTETWMNENNKVNTAAGGLKGKIEGISGLASTLTDITTEVKSAKEQIQTLDKEELDRKKDDNASVEKATQKHSDPEVSDTQTLQEAE